MLFLEFGQLNHGSTSHGWPRWPTQICWPMTYWPIDPLSALNDTARIKPKRVLLHGYKLAHRYVG